MKTPEEIKRALTYCASETRIGCRQCPYHEFLDAPEADAYCSDKLKRDALEYIERLETGKRPHWEKYGGYLTCSECHDVYIMREWVKDGKWRYCPHCGSKMEVET